MRTEQRHAYNLLRDDTLPHVIKRLGLDRQVALASGLGDAIVHRREAEAKRRKLRKISKLARRRNR